jgi:hypothetical protein
MSTTNLTPCICGNCPAIRAARGLQPFCALQPSKPNPTFRNSIRARAYAKEHGGIARHRGFLYGWEVINVG